MPHLGAFTPWHWLIVAVILMVLAGLRPGR
jgi:Sec-independent protein translocase protein TatA